jgi:hypothetical protein
MKYTGEKGVSPIDGKEYHLFNDLSNPAFKHYIDPSSN